MKNRPMMALLLSVALFMSVLYPVSAPKPAKAATIKLNRTSLTVRAGRSKVLKMTGTYHTVAWSISSGSSYVKLKNYKRKQVTVVGKKKGKATIKGTIWYSSNRKLVMKCKVTVLNALWECPRCGMENDTNFCSNCGEKKPNPSASPTPTASMSPRPTASGYFTPTPTPVSPDLLSNVHMVMVLNRTYYFNVQLYANPSAMTFYDRVCKRQIAEYNMGPDGPEEKVCLITPGISTYISASYLVSKGELFMYGTDVLKLSGSNHSTSAFPTRIGKVISEHVSMIDQALATYVDGRTTIQFKQYM